MGRANIVMFKIKPISRPPTGRGRKSRQENLKLLMTLARCLKKRRERIDIPFL